MKAYWRYAIEAFIALMLLGVFVRLSRVYAPQIAGGTLHTAIVFLPIVPIALFGIVGLRLYRALDEMLRRQILVAITGGVWLSQLVSMAYRYMPDAGLPSLPPGAPLIVVCTFFVAVTLGLRDSLFDMRKHK